MNSAIVAAIVRHVLTLVGGGLVARYGLDGAEVESIVGALAGAIGLAWSVYEKRARK